MFVVCPVNNHRFCSFSWWLVQLEAQLNDLKQWPNRTCLGDKEVGAFSIDIHHPTTSALTWRTYKFNQSHSQFPQPFHNQMHPEKLITWWWCGDSSHHAYIVDDVDDKKKKKSCVCEPDKSAHYEPKSEPCLGMIPPNSLTSKQQTSFWIIQDCESSSPFKEVLPSVVWIQLEIHYD